MYVFANDSNIMGEIHNKFFVVGIIEVQLSTWNAVEKLHTNISGIC